MNLSDLINQLVIDTLSSTAAFRGELVLCATIVLILMLRVFNLTSRIDSFYVMLAGSTVALYLAGPWQTVEPTGGSQQLFTGLLVYDSFTIFFRTLLFFFAVLFAIFTRISGVPDRDAAPDVYTLVLGATLGMCLMASSNHLLMVFLGVEMASVPSYALAGILKGRRQSSEAALKYAVYGAGTAGIMLYGISLLAGVLGSMHLPTMGVRLAELLQTANLHDGTNMVLALGGLMILVGIAFKLSAVPFHFWCPDVFEGASAEVNAFLSVASKAAALALLVRVAIGFGSIAVPSVTANQVVMFSVSEQAPTAQEVPSHAAAETATPAFDRPAQIKALGPARDFLARVLAFMAIITCTFGNLAAYGQTNIKRLLAYSTIAQAGYMIMPIPAAMVLAGKDPHAASAAIAAMAFYAAVYLFMNLGAFAVVAFLRNALHSEDIADYAGLIRRSPIVVVFFAIILFSLIGLPPLAGFNGKLLIFSALVDAELYYVLVVGGLNTAISLYYYLRVVKIMTIDPEPENRVAVNMSFIPATYVAAIALPLVVLGIWWNNLNEFALFAAAHLF